MHIMHADLIKTSIIIFHYSIYAENVHDKQISAKKKLTACCQVHTMWYHSITGLILGLCLANERRCYFVTMSLIGWAQT